MRLNTSTYTLHLANKNPPITSFPASSSTPTYRCTNITEQASINNSPIFLKITHRPFKIYPLFLCANKPPACTAEWSWSNYLHDSPESTNKNLYRRTENERKRGGKRWEGQARGSGRMSIFKPLAGDARRASSKAAPKV